MPTRVQKYHQKNRKKWLLASLAAGLALLIFAVYWVWQDPDLRINFIPNEHICDVPLENQLPALPNGCEVTSLSMLLRDKGYDTTKRQLGREIPHVRSFEGGDYRGNPHRGFVGYMSIANAGWCVYNEPLYNLAKKYDPNAVNYTGHDFNGVICQVAAGHPVLIICSTTFKPVHDMQTWKTHQGKVKVTPSSHCVVVTGYNKRKGIVYINDPYGYKNKAVNWANLAAVYKQQGQQAIYLR
jgi:uncharacterized protein YvpB